MTRPENVKGAIEWLSKMTAVLNRNAVPRMTWSDSLRRVYGQVPSGWHNEKKNGERTIMPIVKTAYNKLMKDYEGVDRNNRIMNA